MDFTTQLDAPTSLSTTPWIEAPETKRSSVDRLVEVALAHRAVQHPFLETFASGGFGSRTPEVARELARWYHGYSSRFPLYLQAVIQRLQREDHRELLGENLAEERGRLDPDERETIESLGIDIADVDGVPHPVLFERYCDAVGITADIRRTAPSATLEWRSTFLGALRAGSAAFGVGALGLATESIVAATYEKILDGLKRVDGLDRRDMVFFELHCHVDDQHQEDLLEIACDLAAENGGMAELERGMLASLELRANFWDALHASCLGRPYVIDNGSEVLSA
ncbi:MAG: iron-containing redox enzyme family protein [Planctomycetota bacterium]